MGQGMSKIKQIVHTRSLKLGFGILITIFVGFGLFVLYDIQRVADLSHTIYHHPLVVSNAALHANVSIAKMHRNMKDVVLFKSSSRIRDSIEAVSGEEKQVYRHLNVVKENILGEKGKTLEEDARHLFDEWRPIRDEVIGLVNNNQRELAANITIGKGAYHVNVLEEKMIGLTNYARAKASEFTEDTQRVHSRLKVTSIFFLIVGILSSLLVAFLTLKRNYLVSRELLESQAELQNLLQTIQAGIVVHDVEKNKVKSYNRAALKFLGLTNDQLLGKSTVEPGWGFIDENGVTLTVDDYPVNLVKRTQRPLLDYIIGIEKHSEPEPTWVIINANPQFDQHGMLREIIVSSMDITELRSTQSQLRKKDQELTRSQKMESIGYLAGGIAHDFNNILSSVLGFSELALDEVEKGSTMEDNLQEIYAGGLRAKDIVNQILAFARQSDEEKKPTRVDVIIIEALKLIRPSTPSTIEIRKELGSSSLITGNATQIHQIIMNLCTNAAHAMEDNGGIMEVTLKDVHFRKDINIPGGLEKGKYIELAISDTGSGIEPEHIDSIFDPYFTTKETGKGTGMGLAMVRGIVESYGGTILVESSPSVKTRFTIYLPITSNLDNEITFETKTLPGGDEHILFVDDEPPIARMGSRMLESLGYQVTTRTSSIEALELFKAKPDDFQLVITDMTMPHMTGDKFAIELKQIRADIPIVLCTGYSNKIDADIAQKIGINAFTYKPFSKADLASTVREVLDKA